MAFVIEVTDVNGVVDRVNPELSGGNFTARAGQSYRLVNEDGRPAGAARLRRVGDDLVVDQLPNQQSVALQDFFSACAGESSCTLHLDTLGGQSAEAITPNSEPIAALGTGGFLIWTSPTLAQPTPLAPESEVAWKPILGGVAVAGLLAGAGGGHSGSSTAVGADQTAPPAPVIDNVVVNSTKPVISGTAQAGATVTVLLDLGNGAGTVSYRTTSDEQGKWAIDTATDNPFAGRLPSDGLPTDAPISVRAVAANVAGNSAIASGTIEVDTVAPIRTATLSSLESNAPAPGSDAADDPGSLTTDIGPGPVSNGGLTNDNSPTLSGRIDGPLNPGESVVVARNGVPAGTATVTGLNWTFTDIDVPAGQYSYTTYVADQAGNGSASSAPFSVRIDGSAPATPTLDLIADNDIVTLAEAQAGVAVTGSAQPGATVLVSWGAVTQSTSADENGVFISTFGVSELPGDGRLAIQAVARDSFGNTSAAAERPVIISTGLPAAPVIDTDQGALDGTVPSINAAQTATGFTITGHADPGNAIEIVFTPSAQGQPVSATAVVGADGRFAIDFGAGALTDGSYSLRATVTDFAGASVSGPAVPVLVDTGIPVASASITAVSDNEAGNLGDFASGSLINDASPTLVGTISAPLAANESVRVFRDGQEIGAARVTGTDWQFTDNDPALTSGQYAYTAVVADTADNLGPRAAQAFTVGLDLVAPASPTIAALTGDDLITAAETASGISVNGTATPGAQVQLDWAGAEQSARADAQGNWSARFASAPQEGRTQITATVADAAGNEAQAFRTVVVDSVAPATPSISTIANDDVVNRQEADAGITISGRGEAGTTVDVHWGNLNSTTMVSNAGFWSTQFSTVPAQGATLVSVTATDRGGNSSAAATRTVQVDTQAPGAPEIFAIEGNDAVTAAEAADGIPVTGRADAGASMTVDWAGQTRSTVADGNGQWGVDFPSVPAQGNSAIVATASDSAGNTSAPTQRSVSVNTALPPPAPVINTIAGDDRVNQAEGNLGVTITGSAQAGALVSVNWGGQSRAASVDGNGNWSAFFDSGSIPADGSSTVNVTASNIGGTSPGTARSVLVDRVPPATPRIADIASDNIVNASEANAGVPISGSSEAGAAVTVNWQGTAQQTTAGASGAWSVTYPAAQVPADAGSTTVSVVATNSGGASAPATRAVAVDRSAPTSPVIAAVAGDNVIDANEASLPITVSGSAEAGSILDVRWGNDQAGTTSNAAGNWTVNFAPIPVTIGASQITAVATDAAGNNSLPISHSVVVQSPAPPPAPQLGAIATDNIVNAAEAQAGVSLSGTSQADAAIRTDWAGQIATTVADGNGSWAITYATSQLPDDAAATTLSVTASNLGGTSAATTRVITVDTSAPAAPTIAPVAGDDIISVSEAQASIVVNGQTQANAQVVVNWGSEQIDATSDSAGLWSVDFQRLPVATGDSVITARVSDTAGNTSAPTTHPVTVADAPPPAPPAPTISTVAGDDVINANEAQLPVTVSGTAAASATINMQWGNAALSTTTAADGNWSVIVPVDQLPADGATEVSATAMLAQVSSALTIHPVQIDTQAPAAQIEIVNLLDSNFDPSAIIFDGGATADEQPEVVLSLDGVLATDETVILYNNGVQIGPFTGSEFADQTHTVELGTLESGEYTLIAGVTDAAGNAGPLSDPFVFQVDPAL